MKEDITAAPEDRAEDDAGLLRELSELIRQDVHRYARRLDAEEEINEM